MSGFKIFSVLERSIEDHKHSYISVGCCESQKCCILLRPPLQQDIPMLYLGTTGQENQLSIAKCHSHQHNSKCAWSSLMKLKIGPEKGFIISTVSGTRLHTGKIQDCTQTGYILV